MEENNYLGQEKVGSLLQKFAISSTQALIIFCLYNVVNYIFVGNDVRYLGNAASNVSEEA